MRSLQYRPIREASDNKKEEPAAQAPAETPVQSQDQTDGFDESVTIN
jgi:hypothetical protein